MEQSPSEVQEEQAPTAVLFGRAPLEVPQGLRLAERAGYGQEVRMARLRSQKWRQDRQALVAVHRQKMRMGQKVWDGQGLR